MLSSCRVIFLIVKINSFCGDLTDVLATTNHWVEGGVQMMRAARAVSRLNNPVDCNIDNKNI